MGKCVDQVYFIEKWSKRQGLNIAISQQFSYVNFSMIIVSLSVGIIDTQLHIYAYIYTFFRTVSDLCEILLENFSKYGSVGQSRFTQQAIVVNTCESDHF